MEKIEAEWKKLTGKEEARASEERSENMATTWSNYSLYVLFPQKSSLERNSFPFAGFIDLLVVSKFSSKE